MYTINKSVVAKVIEETDIVELISEDIELIKKGSNFVGLCPFHQDNNPSFTVSPAKHIYKCFVCGQGGNAVTYLQEKRKMSFQDSVVALANKLDIKIEVQQKKNVVKEHIVLDDVARYYQTVLLAMKTGSVGREYLKERGFSKEIMDDFRIGYAPGDNLLIKYLENQMVDNNQYTNFEVESVNVLYGEYEFFRKRVIIPIIDDEDNVVGFSGRSIDGEEPKYINSKDSKIFQKKNILYNMNRARKYLNDETIIIVEGYFDVIALSKIGINNVVAIMGTAFGIDHVKLLKKYRVKNIVLCLDQDEVGVKSSLKIGELLLKNSIGNLSVVTYDGHKDIDEYIKANDHVEELFKTKKDYFEFKIEKFKKYYDLTSLDGKMSYLSVVANGLEQINPTKMNMIKLLISDVIGLDVDKVLTLPDATANISERDTIVPNEYDGNVHDAFEYDVPPPTNDEIYYGQVPAVGVTKYKTDVPTDEDALIQYALMSRKNCHEVVMYSKQNDFKFDKHVTLFECLVEYYQLFEEFDLIEFMNISHPHDFIDIIKRMQYNETIDMEKIHLIFSNNKQRVAGINMFRKKGR